MLEKKLKFYHAFIYNLKMRYKLLVIYSILIIFPLGIFYFVLFPKISRILEDHAKFSSAHSFEQADSFLSYKIKKIKESSDFVVFNATVRNILDHPYSGASLSKRLVEFNDLTNFLVSMEENQEIRKALLYVPDGALYNGVSNNIFSVNTVKNASWYKSFTHNGYSVSFFPSQYFSNLPGESATLSIIRYFNSTNNYRKPLGILRLDFSKSDIENIIRNSNAVDGSITYIQNSRGEVVAASDYKAVARYVREFRTFTPLSTQNAFSELTLQSGHAWVRVISLPESDWYMITVVPQSSITREAENYRNYMLLLIFALGSFAYVLAYALAHSIIKRISILQRQMRKFQNGDFSAHVTDIGRDEIGSLTESYNYMIQKISLLVEEQRLSAIKLKSTELKALQAQINPHFLYNSLEMINCFSYQNRVEEVNTIIQELARFYKLSLNKGDDLAPLGNELDHVSAYVNIQNLRFNNRISLEFEIDDVLNQYKMPKIILQPIIENSIIHGILEKDSKCGIIRISASQNEHFTLLQIADDGVGIPQNILGDLNSLNTSGFHSSNYGIRNVSERIKLFFGDNYGLVYESTLGRGTTVTIQLPLIKDENE